MKADDILNKHWIEYCERYNDEVKLDTRFVEEVIIRSMNWSYRIGRREVKSGFLSRLFHW